MERTRNIDIAQIYELWNEYAAALLDGDPERWMSLWVDGGIQMRPDTPRCVGKQQIHKKMQPLFDLCDTSNMIIHAEEVRILGNWAYSYGTFKFEMTTKEGGKTTSYTGKFLDILEKQVDGSWKIAIDCHNYNEPYELSTGEAGAGLHEGGGDYSNFELNPGFVL